MKTTGLRAIASALMLSVAFLPADAQVRGGNKGGAGSAVSVTSASPNLVITPTPGTGTFTIGTTVVLNAQVGTSYTVVASDCGKLVSFNNASPVAVTLPQAIGSFAAGCAITFQNRGAGTATITPGTSTINGSASLALTQNQGCDANSDGTNWQVSSCTALVSGGGTPAGSGTEVQYRNAGAFGAIAGSSWNGTTLGLPPLSVAGNIDLSGAASRNILMNATSEIDVGGATKISFSGGSIFLASFTAVGGSGAGLASTTCSSTSATLKANWSLGTGWGCNGTDTLSAVINSVERERFTNEGIFSVQATAPVPTGTGSPTIATGSTDEAGEVTAGTSATSVIITFNLTHASAPFCVVTAQPQISSFAYTLSNTAITITQTATSADKINYVCRFHA